MNRRTPSARCAGRSAPRLFTWSLALTLLCSGAVLGQERDELVILWSGGTLPQEAMSPPAGTVVKLVPEADPNPGALPEDDMAPALLKRSVARPPGEIPPEFDAAPAEVVSLLVVDPTAPAHACGKNSVAALNARNQEQVLWIKAGAGLPSLAESPPARTVVKLGLAPGTAKPGLSRRTVVDLAIPYGGGPLPPEALSPPPGIVVGLVWSPGDPTAPGATAGVSEVETSMPELVIPYDGGDLPEEALSPPAGTVVKLADPDAL